jgi:hypothetical protein
VFREYIHFFPMFERGLFNLRMLGPSLPLNQVYHCLLQSEGA